MSKRYCKYTCDVCKRKTDDNLQLGELITKYKAGITVHHFCLLLSHDFEQRGIDTSGIMGFLYDDINEGLRISSKKTCNYCHKKGASVHCAHKNCSIVFHLPCGQEKGCVSEFKGHFPTYCHLHNNEFHLKDFSGKVCVICSEDVGKTRAGIQTKCCGGVFHRLCLAKMASYGGYFFKCPLCNNSDDFRRDMKKRGIFIPDRDAAWELETNAYQDLMSLSQTCEAPICLCKNGRTFGRKNWTYELCSSCGFTAIHTKCLGDEEDFICDLCVSIQQRKEVSETETNENEIESARIESNMTPESSSSGNSQEEEEEDDKENTIEVDHADNSKLNLSERTENLKVCMRRRSGRRELSNLSIRMAISPIVSSRKRRSSLRLINDNYKKYYGENTRR